MLRQAAEIAITQTQTQSDAVRSKTKSSKIS